MSDALSRLVQRWRTRQIIYAGLITLTFVAGAVLGLVLFPQKLRDFLPEIIIIWLGVMLWIFIYTRQIDAALIRPLVALGRDAEAQNLLGRPVPIGDYTTSLIAPLAEIVAKEPASMAEGDGGANNFLADLVQVLDQAVVILSTDHRLLLINNRAREFFAPMGGLALGGDLTDYFVRDSIEAAIIRQMMEPNPMGERIFLSSKRDHNLFTARLTVIKNAAGTARGYVLSTHDSTHSLANLHGLERAFDTLMLGARGFAQAGIFYAAKHSDAEFARYAEETARFLHELRARGEALTGNAWPKSAVSLRVFVDLLRQHIPEISLDTDAPKAVVLHADTAAIIAALEALVTVIANEGRRTWRLRLETHEDSVKFILYAEAPVPIALVERAQAQTLSQLPNTPTAEEVMRAHSTEIWPHAEDDGTALVFILERKPSAVAPSPDGVEFYDFRQPARPVDRAMTALDELAMVVFDTETTGLDPAGGDQVVSIAAVRVLNGRVIASEVFEALVNPGRNIPRTASAVHGITNAMVADAPPFDAVLRAFHRFANGAVLVAHNAAFDMAFVRKGEEAAGLRFDQPVLDTVFMSAFLYDHSRAHTLDDLAGRVDVVIDDFARHSALGDAMATAEILVRFLPLLRARGVERLDQMIEIGAQMRAIRRQQRQYGG